MFSGATTLLAATITWASNGFPPISCSTLGRCDFSRVPLPAAMMTTASFAFDSMLRSPTGNYSFPIVVSRSTTLAGREVRGLRCLRIEPWGTHIFYLSNMGYPPPARLRLRSGAEGFPLRQRPKRVKHALIRCKQVTECCVSARAQQGAPKDGFKSVVSLHHLFTHIRVVWLKAMHIHGAVIVKYLRFVWRDGKANHLRQCRDTQFELLRYSVSSNF